MTGPGLLLSAAGLGFLLGMRHATDADHVVAITTIVGRQRTLAAAGLIGALWGMGHTLTVTLVGLAIIVFGLAIPPPVGLGLELLVGLMLVLLGVLTLSGVMTRLVDRFAPPHEHVHAHDDHTHTHAHDLAHELEDLEERPLARTRPTFSATAALSRLGTFNLLRPITIGIVHGLAGSAAIALLVLASVPEVVGQLVFLAIFNVGVIAGMGLVTSVVGLPFVVASSRFDRLHRVLVLGSGIVSVALGLLLIYQVGFVDGLFTGNPTWTPG
jgi:high-affinity nickel-transport protein